MNLLQTMMASWPRSGHFDFVPKYDRQHTVIDARNGDLILVRLERTLSPERSASFSETF